MTLEEIREICLGMKAVTEDIKWEDHLCFSVGDKMFVITSPEEVPVAMSFSAGEENFEKLCSREGFSPAPYLARYKWLKLDDISRLGKKEAEMILKKAYDITVAKLPAGKKKKFGLA